MAKAALLIGGYLKRLTNLTNYGFNIRSGYITSFVFDGIKYVHVNKTQFKEKDVASLNLLSAGYYAEAEFLKYLVKKDYTAHDISKFALPLSKLEDGIPLDEIYVRKLNITFPYTNFCQVDDVHWPYAAGMKLTDDTQEQNIIIPPEPISQTDEININIHPVAKFFHTQKIQLLNAPNFPDQPSKDLGAYYISKIALYIDRIHREIFPLFTNQSGFQNYIDAQDIEWQNADLLIEPTLDDFRAYLANIINFYVSLYSNQLLIIESEPKDRLYWFAYVLPASALAIMPVFDKVEILKKIAAGGIVETNRLNQLVRINPVNRLFVDEQINEEQFLLKIIESVTIAVNQNDEFLDDLLFLYENGFGNKTSLFEVLYSGLDDNRLKAYSFKLLNDSDNRMMFINLINSIWLKSRYNPYFHSPSYTEEPIFGGVYTESYFLTSNGLNYYNPDTAPPFIIYESGSINEAGKLDSTFSTSFRYKLNGLKMEVEKITTTFSEIIKPSPMSEDYKVRTTTEKYGVYHLFQPVTIVGFKPDLELKIPANEITPIIYIYYMVQYSAIKYLDFGVMLTIEIALNFTGIGELQNLKYLGYLRYISKLRSLGTELPVLVWNAVLGLNDVFLFSTANASAMVSFIGNTTADPATQRAAEKANELLGYVMLGSLSSSLYLRRKVIESAISFTSELDELNRLGIAYDINPDLESLVRNLAGNDSLVISFTRNKIISLPEGDNLLTMFNTFENPFQIKFGKDFGFLKTEALEWKILNDEQAMAAFNWKALTEKGYFTFAKDIKVIKTQKVVDNLLLYSANEELKQVLTTFKLETQLKFSSKFPADDINSFNEFAENPPLLKSWQRYSDDLKVKDSFASLNKEQQLIFLKNYGFENQLIFDNIKSNPSLHLERLLDYSPATHHAEYFNIRRGEMLPPNLHNTTGNGGLFKKVEVDSIIDTEILYGGHARTVIEGLENGDIVMSGGSLNGKKIDFMGLEPDSYKGWSRKFNRNYNKFTGSIESHIAKLNTEPYVDIIILDYKYFETTSILSGREAGFIRNQVDSYLQVNFSEYLNSNKLIKINY